MSKERYAITFGYFAQYVPGSNEKQIEEMKRLCDDDKVYIDQGRSKKYWDKLMMKGVVREQDTVYLQRISHIGSGIDDFIKRLEKMAGKGATVRVIGHEWDIDLKNFQKHLHLLRRDQQAINMAINAYQKKESGTAAGAERMTPARAKRIESVFKLWKDGMPLQKIADTMGVARPTIDRDLAKKKVVKSEWVINRLTGKRIKKKDIKTP